MKERPILFSAPMVREILAGTKTQTRRIVKPQPEFRENAGLCWKGVAYGITTDRQPYVREFLKHCPYGAPGDRLWVRETHAQFAVGNRTGDAPLCVAYRATCDDDGGFNYVNNGDEIMRLRVTKWTPAIHMPRWASRITLEVTGVRVERLQAISEEDARAEGVNGPHFGRWGGADGRTTPPESEPARPWAHSFFVAWNEIYGPDAWIANPLVWVVEFRRLEAQERAA